MGVEVEALVDQQAVGDREHVDRAAELDQHVAVRREAGAEGRGDVVGEAGDDRRAGAQARRRGGPGGHAADDVGGVADRAPGASRSQPAAASRSSAKSAASRS